MVFKSGESGNPGGVHKTTKIVRDYAREYSIEAIEILVQIMRNSDEKGSVRVSAASVVLDRGHGKPASTVDDNVKDLVQLIISK